jgi:cysteine desulfurase/selenocysteine lyase
MSDQQDDKTAGLPENPGRSPATEEVSNPAPVSVSPASSPTIGQVNTPTNSPAEQANENKTGGQPAGPCDDNSCAIGPSNRQAEFPDVRKEFPIFANRPELVFFDNASTTQKPLRVIEAVSGFYTNHCANAGRASYSLSTKAASRIAETRKKVASFLNADPADVVFTSGATDSLNMVALTWGLANLKDGDEVMVCLDDHKSTVLPWFNLKALLQRFGVNISIVTFDIHPEGDYSLKSIREKVTARTRLLAMTHVHHVYGMDMELGEIRKIVGDSVLISLDASQSVGHRKVDVKELGVQFLSFSGHKMFAANGVGILWVAPQLHSQLTAVRPGGSTPGTVQAGTFKAGDSSLAALLESGTLNIPSILSLVPAIEFIEKLGVEKIEAQISKLSFRLYDGLKNFPGIEFSPGFGHCGCHNVTGYGILSFRFAQLATSDLAFLLDSENFMVRTGDHCVTSQTEGDDFIRVSLHVYNTEEEIDKFVTLLQAHVS